MALLKIELHSKCVLRHCSLWKEAGFIYQKGDFKFYNHATNIECLLC